MNNTGHILFGIVFSVLLACTATARDDITVVATCNRKIISIDDTVLFKVQVNGTQNAKAPKLENLDGFTIVQGPGIEQSMSIDNLKTTSSITYSYVLSPSKTGTLTIGPVEMKIGSSTYRTRPIEIKVIKSQAPPERNMFIVCQTDKDTAYVNGQILLTVMFYFKDINVASIDQPQSTINGFRSYDVGQPTQGRKVREGQQYNTVTFQKLLIPIKTGTITLEPVELMVKVRKPVTRRRQSFFDDPFGMLTRYQTSTQVVKSKPVTLHIRELPPEGKPASFNGDVGILNLRASVEPHTVEEGEPVTLTAEVSGECFIDSLALNLPTNTTDFRVYDPETSRKSSIAGGRLIGTKTYKQMWVPTSTNAHEIPRLLFSYFDIEHGKYVTLSKGPFKLTVTPAPGEKMMVTERVAAYNPGSRIRILRQDIFGIKTETASVGFTHRAYTDPLLISMVCTPPVLWAGLAVFTFSRRRLRSDARLYRRVHASRKADSRLRQAREALKQQDTKRFYAELSDALSNYIADKLHIAAPQVNSGSLTSLLIATAVTTETKEKLKTLFDTCDFARFANSTFDAQKVKEHFTAAQILLRKLHKELK